MAKYDEGVLIGNWYEERLLRQEKDSDEKEHLENLEKVQHTLKCLLKPDFSNSPPTVYDGTVRIGNVIQLVNPGTSQFYMRTGLADPRPAYTLSLAILNPESYTLSTCYKIPNLVERLIEEASLTILASPNMKANARNIFKIESPFCSNKPEQLRYGQPIWLSLQLGATAGCQHPRMYLACDLGRIGQKLSPPGALPLYFEIAKPTFASEWRIEAADPQLREGLEGMPIKFNEKVLIKHNRTNKPLALELKYRTKNLFGTEVKVSANKYIDSHKAELDVNVWTIINAHDAESETQNEDSTGLIKKEE